MPEPSRAVAASPQTRTDPRDAELERLRAENAALQAQLAGRLKNPDRAAYMRDYRARKAREVGA